MSNLKNNHDLAFVSPGGTTSDSLGRQPQVGSPISHKAPVGATSCLDSIRCRPFGALIGWAAWFLGLTPQANRCRRSAVTIAVMFLLSFGVAPSMVFAQNDGEADDEPVALEPTEAEVKQTNAPSDGKDAKKSADDADKDSSKYDALLASLTIFVLAVFVGFEVITKVPPTLHTPLMSGSNAISGITIVGALLATGFGDNWFVALVGMIALVLATINVVGGFLVTHRMLEMFKKKK